MHMIATVPAPRRVVVPRDPRAAARSQPRAERPVVRRDAGDLRLIVSTLALLLGLVMVTMSLLPVADEAGHPGQNRPPVGRVRAASAAAPARRVSHALAPSAARPTGVEREPVPVTHPSFNAAGQWVSPLYPQNGVTLWDRIRVSTSRDRRAFLLGTATQLHAPATAAILHPRSGLPGHYG